MPCTTEIDYIQAKRGNIDISRVITQEHGQSDLNTLTGRHQFICSIDLRELNSIGKEIGIGVQHETHSTKSNA